MHVASSGSCRFARAGVDFCFSIVLIVLIALKPTSCAASARLRMRRAEAPLVSEEAASNARCSAAGRVVVKYT